MQRSIATWGKAAAATIVVGMLFAGDAVGQPGRGGLAPASSPRDAAPIDLSGQWVSIVTEDWRFRMMAGPKGEYDGIMLTPAGRAVADAWDPARDETEGNACKAYGAGGIMRMPGRIRISWENDTTMRLETDAGSQVRSFHFGEPPPQAERTWQGQSRAEWILHGSGRGRPAENGTLKVTTTNVRPGYVRRNGVPYGEQAVITEYFDLLRQPDGTEWIVVKTIVEDPEHLAEPYIVSSNFRKEDDTGRWNPTDCGD